MAETKVTKKEYFGMIKDIVSASDVDNKQEILDFCDGQIAIIDNKAAKAKEAAVKKKEQGDELRDRVQEKLTAEFQTADQITEAIGDENVTKSKVISRLTSLVKAGIAVKEQTKIDSKKLMTYKLS